jgi:hypothetical protein
VGIPMAVIQRLASESHPARAVAERGCAFWQREPGAEG